jgi:hypothetical protein
VRGDVTVEAPGLDRWLPVPTREPVDVQAEQGVRALVGDVASQDFLEETVAMVAGAARIVGRESEALGPYVLTYGAWMLLPAPGLLLPGPVATLRLRPLDGSASDDDAVEACADLRGPRHGPVDVDVLDTASGRALTVRYRPVVEDDDGRAVHEHRLVLWRNRPTGMLLELSLYVVDLVEGGAAEEPLFELARGIRWQVDEGTA